jgi:hypothetical protein
MVKGRASTLCITAGRHYFVVHSSFFNCPQHTPDGASRSIVTCFTHMEEPPSLPSIVRFMYVSFKDLERLRASSASTFQPAISKFAKWYRSGYAARTEPNGARAFRLDTYPGEPPTLPPYLIPKMPHRSSNVPV